MNKETLQELINQIHQHCTQLLFEKNGKYADSIDVFTNFKSRNNYLKTRKSIIGAQLDSAAKHIVAIPNCVDILDKDGGVITDENVQKAQQLFESLSDVVSYSYLMLAELSSIVSEWKQKQEQPEVQTEVEPEEYTLEEVEEEVNPKEEDYLKKILQKE